MADQTNSSPPSTDDPSRRPVLADEQKRLGRRYRRDRRFKLYTIGAVVLAGTFLLLFIGDLLVKGLPALRQTQMLTPIHFTPEALHTPEDAFPERTRELVSRDEQINVMWEARRSEILLPIRFSDTTPRRPEEAVQDFQITEQDLPVWRRSEAPIDVPREHLLLMVDPAALDRLAEEAQSDPELIGRTVDRWLPASEALEQFMTNSTGLPEDALETANWLDTADRLRNRFNVETFGEEGRTVERWILARWEVDQYLKGKYSPYSHGAEQYERFMTLAGHEPTLTPDIPAVIEKLKALRQEQIEQKAVEILNVPTPTRLETLVDQWRVRNLIDELIEEDRLRLVFNHYFFLNGDSQHPESAGIAPAVVGSVMLLGLVFVFCMPIGVLTSIYLEEFAPDNWLTQIIEVNINNLAAIPSILFGVLGLAAFINFFGMPRSSALVGGATLALMTLPIIIISSRAALRAVPHSIRTAGHAMGASRWQVVTHHVLPQSISGILTGSIIGLAQAMGETAPLIIVGLIAFVPDIAGGITDTTTVMPAQIFSWWGNSQRAFTERAALMILCLLLVLFVMNGLAVLLRAKSEKKW